VVSAVSVKRYGNRARKRGGGRRLGEKEWHRGEGANPLTDLLI